MSREIKKQLRDIRTGGRLTPDRDWVVRNRDILVRQISNTIREDKPSRQTVMNVLAHGMHIFLPQSFLAASRSASVAVFVALAAVGGWIASVSASNSLPGDALYNVKLATEKTELIVASVVSTKKEVTTLLKHASNRVEEYQKSKTADQATQVLESLKKSMQSTSESLDHIQEEEEADAVTEVANVVTQKTDELIASLEGSHAASEGDVKKEVGEATHLIELTGVRAVEVLVEQHASNNLAEVKQTVEKKLEKIATDFTALNKDVAAVSSVVASSSIATSSVSAAALTVSSTAGVSSTVETVKAAEQKVVEASKIVEKTVAEAKTLVQNNDLLGALKKVQELAEVKKDTNNIVIDAQTVGGTFLQTSSSTPSSASATSTTTLSTSTSTPKVEASPKPQ